VPTMTCERFGQLYRAYLEGDLEESTCGLVERHADECAACRDALLAELTLPGQWEQSLADGLASSPPDGWKARVEALLPPQPSDVRDECYLMWPDLSALLDRELDAAAYRSARAHARGCRPCAAELRAMARLDRGLRGLRAAPPTSLRPALCLLTGDRGFGTHGHGRRSLLWLSSAAAAVALFAFGAGALHILSPGEPSLAGAAIHVAQSPAVHDAEQAVAELPADKTADTSALDGTDTRTVASYDTSAATLRTTEAARRRGARKGSPDLSVRRTSGTVGVATAHQATTAPPAGTAMSGFRTAPTAETAPAPLGLDLDGWERVVAGLPAATSDAGPPRTTPRGPMVVDAVAVPASAPARVDISFEPAASAGLY
jgi:hypothetical protein